MRLVYILGIYFVLFLFVFLFKYFLFGYVDWDLAFFNQASWKLLHGDQFVSLVGINYFGDHSYFFHYFLLPFYFFFASPLTLIVLKLLAFCLSAYFLYQIAEERLGGKSAVFLLLLYLIFPGNVFGLLYEFNPEAFAPPLIVLMFTALHKRKIRLLLLWAVFLVLIKENMFLVALAFAVRAFFVADKGDRKSLLAFSLFAVVIFLFLVLYLIPHFRGLQQHAFTVRYAGLGQSMQEVLLSPILQPLSVLKRLICPLNITYLAHLFSYLLILAPFSPMALILMLPLLLQHMLSGSIPEHTIYYHYVPTMAPFIFFAAIETLAKMGKNKSISPYRDRALILLLIIAVPVLFSYKRTLLHRWDVLNVSQAAEVWKMIELIPSDVAVIATFRFLAPLSARAEVFSFHKLYSDEFNDPKEMQRNELNIHKGFVLSERVGYALLDLDDPWYVATFQLGKESELKRIDAFFNDPHWKVLKRMDKILLLKRTDPKH